MRNHSRKACDASDREGLKISMSDGRHMGGKGLKMAKLASYDLWMFPLTDRRHVPGEKQHNRRLWLLKLNDIKLINKANS